MGDDRQISEVFKLLENISKQNLEISADIKEIKSTLAKQTDDIEQLKKNINVLASENKNLKNQLEIAQRKSKENGIIIFGLKEDEKQDLVTHFRSFIKNEIGVEVEEVEIDNIYRIGKVEKDKARAVLVQLTRNLIKQKIIKNAHKLKGKAVSIAPDLTVEQRSEQKILLKHLKIARHKHYNAKMRGSKLIINGEEYMAEQLQSSESSDREENNLQEDFDEPVKSTQIDIDKRLEDLYVNQSPGPFRITRAASKIHGHQIDLIDPPPAKKTKTDN